MVIDYTCLWWGSANAMYDNRCGTEAQVLHEKLMFTVLHTLYAVTTLPPGVPKLRYFLDFEGSS